MFFLHGPSGAGKGELYARLTDEFRQRGYNVYYASSGELFRTALEDPVLAHELRLGHFADTLRPIMPRLQEIYTSFVETWCVSEYRSVFILDGVIRRTGFTNQRGVHIPAQTRQLANAFSAVHAANAEKWHGCFGPQSSQLDIATENKHRVRALTSGIRQAWHILLDVDVSDAEIQIRRRAETAITGLTMQIRARTSRGLLDAGTAETLLEILDHLTNLLHGRVGSANSSQVPQSGANRAIASNLCGLISEAVEHIRHDLLALSQLAETDSLAAGFRALGLETEIRDEDIAISARQSRLANFVKCQVTSTGPVYIPGLAAQALMKEFGYRLGSDGTFSVQSKRRNDHRLVIQNGHSRGVGLDEFRVRCASTAQYLADQVVVARARLLAGADIDGQNAHQTGQG